MHLTKKINGAIISKLSSEQKLNEFKMVIQQKELDILKNGLVKSKEVDRINVLSEEKSKLFENENTQLKVN